jgi:hypothetical protein
MRSADSRTAERLSWIACIKTKKETNMGFDLSNGDRYFRMGNSQYPKVLNLAFMYGWIPQGTIRNEDLFPPERTGIPPGTRDGYFSSDFQMVTEEDALELAKALERALNDIPKGIYNKQWDTPKKEIEGWDELVEYVKESTDALKFEDGDSSLLFFFGGQKEFIQSFIDFCKAGSFYIE